MKIRLKRLNQAGFDHVMVVAVFVVLFALVGTWFLIHSRAATPAFQFRMWVNASKNTGLCLDDSSSSSYIISYSCNSGDSYQQWTTQSASGGFLIKNVKTGQCVDDSGGKVGSKPNWAHVISWGCNGSDRAQVWNWRANGSYGMLVNAASGACINDPGSSTSQQQLIMYPCSGTGKTSFQESAISSGGGSSSGSTMGQKLIARAERYQGLGYANLSDGYGAGGIVHHDGYGTFVKDCEGGHSGGTPKITGGTNSLCATDCSGFISLVVDDVLHTSYVWIAGAEVMEGGGSSHWHQISASSAKPGDIAVSSDHVEFVRSGTGSGLTSYGEHQSGTTVSSAHMPGSFRVYRWE